MMVVAIEPARSPVTEQHLALFRRHMVEIIDMHFDLAGDEIGKAAPDPRLRRALLDVPRHLLVPQSLMLDLLEIEPGARILEVGTGLGFQAAVMAEMGAQVWSVEEVEEFAEAASDRFAALGYDIQVRVGDGSRSWAEHAPFDGMLVTAAADAPPEALLEQLQPGGQMVIPVGGKDIQQLTVVKKQADGGVMTREVMPVRFTQLEVTT